MAECDSDIKNFEEKEYVNRLKELFPLVEEYQKKKAALVTLGYRVEVSFGHLKVWKEI